MPEPMTVTIARTRTAAQANGDVTQVRVAIKKVNAAKQIVYGEVYAPYVLDTWGEFMTPEDIETMAHRAMQLDPSKLIDTQHDNLPNGSYPVETFIARDGDPDFTPGAWVMGVKVADTLWPSVLSGKLNGFSFQALVRPVEMEITYEVMRDHVGETATGLDTDHTHTYFVQVDDDGQVIGGKTDEVDGHSHTIVKASVTETAAGHSHRFFL
jgi:hypothetical protein